MRCFFIQHRKIVHTVYNSTYLQTEIIPPAIQNLFPLPSSFEFVFNFDDSAVNKLAERILDFRFHKIWGADMKHEFYLNTLSFGEGVIGLEQGSQYYFQKSIADLSFEEGLILRTQWQVFRNY